MDPMPIPKDFLLPLPAAAGDLEIILVVLFLAHIVFVNLMLGGALLSLAAEVRGLTRRPYDALARKIATTVTVNKSLAVVLGVGPLLAINALYGLWFYTANSLTGRAWIAIVPVVAVAFLLLYLHKYTWNALAERKGLHIAIGATGAGLLLLVPFIFLANINLMLFPERWLDVRGFLSAVALANVVPRYLHFLLASIALTALMLAAWLCRRGLDFDAELPGLDRGTVKRELLGIAFGTTALQLLAGPLVLFTLPPNGVSWPMVGTLAVAVSLGVTALVLLWREAAAPPPLSARYWTVVVLLGCTVTLMGVTRHLYRETAIEPHRALVAAHTAAFRAEALGAEMRLAAGVPRLGPAEAAASPGERVFRSVCMACHAVDTTKVGPPLTEIVDIYAGNPEGLIAWVKAPGKKREGFQQMPPISMKDAQYRAVADYILDEVFAAKGEAPKAG
jgi:cytochrome c